MSEATTAQETNWVFGLPPLARAILNIGAVALICLMFYQDRRESLRTAAEDRQMFREELRYQRAAIEKLSRAVDHLAQHVKGKNP